MRVVFFAWQVNLRREKLEITPCYYTAMDFDDHKFGYIRLVNFSQKAAIEMEHAIASLTVSPFPWFLVLS